MRNQILNALSTFEADKNIKIVVFISKVDKVFCAGADIKEIST
jgi:enoyl-CoA hydratase/carnithine racemase